MPVFNQTANPGHEQRHRPGPTDARHEGLANPDGQESQAHGKLTRRQPESIAESTRTSARSAQRARVNPENPTVALFDLLVHMGRAAGTVTSLAIPQTN